MLSSRGRDPARACGAGGKSTPTPRAAPVRRRWTAAALAALALLSGCATPVKSDKMVVVAAAPVHQSRESVAVTVLGGSETSATGSAQISDQGFAQALRESIEKSKLFAEVSDNGAYKLQAFIKRLSQPSIGFDMTATLEAGYTLMDTRTGQAVLRKNIVTDNAAAVGGALIGMDRVRLAIGGAVRKNIEQFITETSRLRLD
jgi:hypothetical protein